jgi:hypothetical protein
MNSRSVIDTVATAAVVVVVLPLLVAIAAFCASFGIEVAAGPGFGMFGRMGAPHVLVLAWTVITVGIVAALVALLVKDRKQHA